MNFTISYESIETFQPAFEAAYEVVKPGPGTLIVDANAAGPEAYTFTNLQEALDSATAEKVAVYVRPAADAYEGFMLCFEEREVEVRALAEAGCAGSGPPVVKWAVAEYCPGVVRLEGLVVEKLRACSSEVRMSNCLLRTRGGGHDALVEVQEARLSLEHTTVHNADAGSGLPLVRLGGREGDAVSIRNSILHHAGGVAAIAHSHYEFEMGAENSFATGGQFGMAGTENIDLTRDGWLTKGSSARNAAKAGVAATDIRRQPRPAPGTAAPDAGCDEWTATVSSEVPDWWLRRHGLGAGGVNEDVIEAYRLGTPPDRPYRPPAVTIAEVEPVTWPVDRVNLAATVEGNTQPLATTTWSAASGPNAGSITFGSVNALSTTATVIRPGEYVFRVTVSDGINTATAQTTVRVATPDELPRIKILSPTHGSALPTGEPFSIVVEATAPEAAPLKLVRLLRDGVPLSSGPVKSGDVYIFTRTESAPGTVFYTAEAVTVFDEGSPATVSLTFYPPGDPPPPEPPEPDPDPDDDPEEPIPPIFERLSNTEPLGLGAMPVKSISGKNPQTIQYEYYGRPGQEILIEITFEGYGYYNFQEEDDEEDFSGGYQWSISTPWGGASGSGAFVDLVDVSEIEEPEEGCPYATPMGWERRFVGTYRIRCP